MLSEWVCDSFELAHLITNLFLKGIDMVVQPTAVIILVIRYDGSSSSLFSHLGLPSDPVSPLVEAQCIVWKDKLYCMLWVWQDIVHCNQHWELYIVFVLYIVFLQYGVLVPLHCSENCILYCISSIWCVGPLASQWGSFFVQLAPALPWLTSMWNPLESATTIVVFGR